MLAIYLGVIETAEEKSKFEALYHEYAKLMKAVAMDILHDNYEAEDIVHDSFLKIIENIDKISDVYCHKTKSYIVIIVRNLAINRYNQRQRRKSIALADYNGTVSEAKALEEYSYGALVDMIKRLPQIYREALLYRFACDYTEDEMAREFNISKAAVRKRIERAKTQLAVLLEENNREEEK